MKCGGDKAEQLAIEYLNGTLPEEEARAFEEHFFACPECFEFLQGMEAARLAAQKMPAPVSPPRISRHPLRWAAGGAAAIAAGIVLAAALHLHVARSSANEHVATAPTALQAAPTQPTAIPAQEVPRKLSAVPQPSKSSDTLELAQLADPELPPYRATRVRGLAQDGNFGSAMESYEQQDYETAARLLAQVPASSAQAPAAAVFLGVCEYKLGHAGDARKALAGLAADTGSAQSETARYYLAQVALQQNQLAAARHWLRQTIALKGDYEQRARAQLNKLPPPRR